MVSTRKKSQSNRRLLSQLYDFYQDIIIGKAASDGQRNAVVNEGSPDQEFTANNTGSSLTTN